MDEHSKLPQGEEEEEEEEEEKEEGEKGCIYNSPKGYASSIKKYHYPHYHHYPSIQPRVTHEEH